MSAFTFPRDDGTKAAVTVVLALTLWRVALLWFNQTGLWVDEAQYWLWGKSFAWGAYSKPPLIGWLIGLVTALFADSPFTVRLAAPLIHAVTALVILALSRRLMAPRTAALAAMTYITMPAVTLGALLISTDTPMLLAIAVALLLQHRLAERSSAAMAVGFGLALGLGLLSKHSMIFAICGQVAAGLVSPCWRPSRRDAGLGALVALAVVVPNLWWIASHDFATLHHLAQSGSAGGVSIHPARALRFFIEQFAVMGPLAFAGFLLSGGKGGAGMRGLWIAALFVLLIGLAQALSGKALANWAVGFTVAGSLVAAPWLIRHPRLSALSLGFGGLVAIVLPILTVFGTDLRGPGGQLLLKRYLGRAEISLWALDYAGRQGADTIAAADRGLLADLSWTTRGSGLAIRATPHPGPPRHHWDLLLPLDTDAARPVVLLVSGRTVPACAEAAESKIAGPGFAEGQVFTLALAGPGCLGSAFGG